MKIKLKYKCKHCGETYVLTGSCWKWFSTPHFGSRKWLKCKKCNSRRHFMKRLNWKGPNWIDWPVDNA